MFGLDRIVVWAIGAALAVAVLAAIGAWAAHLWDAGVAEPYRVEGDERTRAQLQPQIAQLNNALAGLRGEFQAVSRQRDAALADRDAALAQVADVNARWRAFEAEQEEAKAATARALEQARAAAKAQTKKIIELTATAHGARSAESCEGICAQALDTMRAVAADRLRN